MAMRKRGRRVAKVSAAADRTTESAPELVVVTRRQAAFRASAGRFMSAAGENVSDVSRVLTKHKATLVPIFGPTEERVMARLAAHGEAAQAPMEDLSVFYRVEAPTERLEDLRDELANTELVEAAFIKPAVELPRINDMAAAPEEPPPATADFSPRQIYLDAAPAGVDARWAWTQAGGRGRDIRIIDIEGDWRFTHEDLTQNQGGVVAGTRQTGIDWRNHGTAVLGEFSGDVNTIGIVGIAAEAIASGIAHGGIGSAGAINQAATRLRAGDIMLLEMHRPGPRNNFATRADQRGYIAVEWWPDDFAAILNATSRGIIVVEAAGNGAENLDDVLYQTPAPGFPATWRNSFRRTNRDSGAIVVGAGAPPPGTHGQNHGPDRSRLDFSNWGALIDAQGWGREVTTCGYGDLQGGTNEDLWYTDQFSGTSSASPIVVGAVGALQGIARARGTPLTPATARGHLRATGSPQQDEPTRPATQRIGTRPDLRALVARITKVKEKLEKVEKLEKLEKREGKELKVEKREKPERKELKEKREKLEKREKPERKEIKREKIEKPEKLESKELKEGRKELKELKEGRKELKELKDGKSELEKIRDRIEDVRVPGELGEDAALEQRIRYLEGTVEELVHFISSELRPDLGEGALSEEYDLTEYDEGYWE